MSMKYKVHNIKFLYSFIENVVDECTCVKVSGNNFIHLVLHVHDI